MQRIGKIVIIILLWAIVGGYIFYFHSRARHHRTTTLVHSIEVNILDSLREDAPGYEGDWAYLMGMMYATEAMLGLDEYCMEYISAYREGIFGPVN